MLYKKITTFLSNATHSSNIEIKQHNLIEFSYTYLSTFDRQLSLYLASIFAKPEEHISTTI